MPKTNKYASPWAIPAPANIEPVKVRAKRRTPEEMAAARSETAKLQSMRDMVRKQREAERAAYLERLQRERAVLEERQNQIRLGWPELCEKHKAQLDEWSKEWPGVYDHFKAYLGYGYSASDTLRYCVESWRQHVDSNARKRKFQELVEKYKGQEPTAEEFFNDFAGKSYVVPIRAGYVINLATCCGTGEVYRPGDMGKFSGNRIYWQYLDKGATPVKPEEHHKLEQALYVENGDFKMVFNWGDR